MVIDPKSHEVRLKIVLIGLPGAGKFQILESWSSLQGDGQLREFQMGDASIFRASFRWSNLPRKDWSMSLSAYTTEGEVAYSAVTEMLLKDADGICFVAPVDGDRAQAIGESMADLGEILRRNRRVLSEIPLVLHYHQAERIPGFDANLLNDFLGIPKDSVPHVMTRSDDASPLTGSLALLLQKVMNVAEEALPPEATPAAS